ncbi:MAG: 30S ribosomal protein S27ae [Candidatus Woesearchaeota archaeon]
MEGDTLKRSPNCPKCGPAFFLANHTNRLYCGKCHYVEIKAKKN